MCRQTPSSSSILLARASEATVRLTIRSLQLAKDLAASTGKSSRTKHYSADTFKALA